MRFNKKPKSTTTKKHTPDYKKKLDDVFSKYIRLRDSFPYQGERYFRCISCGRLLPFEQADCGHYVNRQHMSTRFSEVNCNAQCRSCNRFDEGNMQGYRKGLVAKYSENQVLLLESMKHEMRQYSDFEYMALIEHYKEEIKKIQNNF